MVGMNPFLLLQMIIPPLAELSLVEVEEELVVFVRVVRSEGHFASVDILWFVHSSSSAVDEHMELSYQKIHLLFHHIRFRGQMTVDLVASDVQESQMWNFVANGMLATGLTAWNGWVQVICLPGRNRRHPVSAIVVVQLDGLERLLMMNWAVALKDGMKWYRNEHFFVC